MFDSINFLWSAAQHWFSDKVYSGSSQNEQPGDADVFARTSNIQLSPAAEREG